MKMYEVKPKNTGSESNRYFFTSMKKVHAFLKTVQSDLDLDYLDNNDNPVYTYATKIDDREDFIIAINTLIVK